MPISAHRPTDSCDERGSALVGVLLLLMMMSALAAALGVSGRTETLVARNHESSAQARAAAEAGLNHATAVVLDYLFDYSANGFASAEEALDALLQGPDGATGTEDDDADNGSLESVTGWGVPIGERLAVGASDGEYDVRVMDEDDPARGDGQTLLDGDADDSNDEDDNPYTDNNKTLVILAVGYGRNGSSVILEALIAPLEFPAIVSNGDFTISGNPTITGDEGGVHANADLDVSGNPSIDQDATATGDYSESGNPDVGGTASGGMPQLTVPSIDATAHLSKADFILTSDGTMVCNDQAGCGGGTYAYGDTMCASDPCNEWEYSDGNNEWSISSNDAVDGTYYIEGKAKISGNPGTAKVPISITLIAEGSIEISGNPILAPNYPELLFVTGGDLKISGNLDVPLTAEGQMLVHEQVMISGNPTLAGQLIVENATSVDNMVTTNSISGNPTISYNGDLGDYIFTQAAWREIR